MDHWDWVFTRSGVEPAMDILALLFAREAIMVLDRPGSRPGRVPPTPVKRSALISGTGHRLHDDFVRVRRDELRLESLAHIRQQLDDIERKLSQLADGGA